MEVKCIGRDTWRFFSKYHYLSDKFPGGKNYCYGLFVNGNQVGFIAYSNYTPHRKSLNRVSRKMILHANRIVIHPDYQGLGLGIKLLNATAPLIKQLDYRVMIKLSSLPLIKSLLNDSKWECRNVSRFIGKINVGGLKRQGFRINCKTYSFLFIG